MKLKNLSDPFAPIDEPCIGSLSADDLVKLHHLMCKIRLVENKIATGRKDGLIGGPVHLSVGQEAIPSALSLYLHTDDAVYGAHRSHSHLLALGSDIYKLFCEVLGKVDGLSGGLGGSMHLTDPSRGFMGSVPIVAATVPLAVGSALAIALKKKNNIAVSYLGDGAMEEGVVHEALNFASQFRLPVLFVVENNLYSSHMHISQRQPGTSMARFADANCIPSAVFDGNNAASMADQMCDIIKDMRHNHKPFFMEAFTYRWYGHVDWRDDIDVGICRSKDELNAWKDHRDPIKRMEALLLSENILDSSAITLVKSDLKTTIDFLWDKALDCDEPSCDTLLDNVYFVPND